LATAGSHLVDDRADNFVDAVDAAAARGQRDPLPGQNALANACPLKLASDGLADIADIGAVEGLSYGRPSRQVTSFKDLESHGTLQFTS